MRLAIATLVLVTACSATPAASEEASGTLQRIRAGIEREPRLLRASGPVVPVTRRETPPRHRSGRLVQTRDSVWNGVLVGAAIGGGGGYLWGRNYCPNDPECQVRTVPVGMLAGAAIGAAVGGVLDALRR